MHTIMIMAGGLLLLAACVLIGRFTGGMEKGALAFIPLWLIAAAVNMWIGVNRAGYSYADEFPIFLLIFAIRRRSRHRCGGRVCDPSTSSRQITT
jgi:hypothetical protein